MAHDVYRHWDADGNLLYIGCSHSTFQRTMGHKTQAHWYDEVVNITIQKYPDEQEGRTAEAMAIRLEKPLHNIVGQSPDVPKGRVTADAPVEQTPEMANFGRALTALMESDASTSLPQLFASVGKALGQAPSMPEMLTKSKESSDG